MDQIKNITQTVIVGAVVAGIQASVAVYSAGQADIATVIGAFVTGAVAFWMRSPKDKK